MRIRHLALAALVAGGLLASSAPASDWIFNSGPYTRNPKTGKRVDQYQKPKTPRTVPYTQYFSNDGPAPYIPYWYYQQELGYPGVGEAPYYDSVNFAPGFSGPVGF